MAQPKTFMLLPDYTHKPSEQVQLGSVLFLSDDTKLPDPDTPLNEHNRITPDHSSVKSLTEEPWSFVHDVSKSSSGGIHAEIPVFAPVGGGVLLGRSRRISMEVKCGRLDTLRFVPTPQYLAKALANEDIKQYCQQHFFPSVYLVTGIKIAQNATIQQSSRIGHHGSVDVSVDTTALGVPLKAGPKLEGAGESSDGTLTTIEGPFILAYELKRIRMRRDGTHRKTISYNKHVLFDDRQPIDQDLAELDEFWEVEDVGMETDHDA